MLHLYLEQRKNSQKKLGNFLSTRGLIAFKSLSNSLIILVISRLLYKP